MLLEEQKIEMQLVSWCRRNRRMNELRVYLLIREQAGNNAGYMRRNTTFGYAPRTFHRVIKNLHNMGWISLTRKSIKIVPKKDIFRSLDLKGRMGVVFRSRHLSDKQTFETFCTAAGLQWILNQQNRMIKQPVYEGLLKSEVVKKNMLSLSVIANKWEMSESTAFRAKRKAYHAGLIDVRAEYLTFVSKEEARFRKNLGEKGIQGIVFGDGIKRYVKRNSDRIWTNVEIIRCPRRKNPKPEKQYRVGYEPTKREYILKGSKSSIITSNVDLYTTAGMSLKDIPNIADMDYIDYVSLLSSTLFPNGNING